jgi:hypothetical protein
MAIINPGPPTNLGADWRAAGSGSRDPAEMRNRILRSEEEPPPPLELGTITNLNATPGNTSVGLTWTPAANATSHLPQRRLTGGSTWTDHSGGALGGSASSATFTGLINGTSYEFRVAASDGTSTTFSNIATASPQEASLAYPNEPAGFTRFAEHDMSFLPPSSGSIPCSHAGQLHGWGETAANYTLVSDQDSPTGAAYRIRYPIGMAGGSEPGRFNIRWPDGDLKAWYVSLWTRVEAPFELPVNELKTWYHGMLDDQSHNGGTGMSQGTGITQYITRSHFAQFRSAVGHTSVATVKPIYLTSQASQYLSYYDFGMWRQYEYVRYMADMDQANGKIRFYCDGVRLPSVDSNGNPMNEDTVRDRSTGFSRGLHTWHWAPVFGGADAGPKTKQDHTRIGHMYVSGLLDD